MYVTPFLLVSQFLNILFCFLFYPQWFFSLLFHFQYFCCHILKLRGSFLSCTQATEVSKLFLHYSYSFCFLNLSISVGSSHSSTCLFLHIVFLFLFPLEPLAYQSWLFAAPGLASQEGRSCQENQKGWGCSSGVENTRAYVKIVTSPPARSRFPSSVHSGERQGSGRQGSWCCFPLNF